MYEYNIHIVNVFPSYYVSVSPPVYGLPILIDLYLKVDSVLCLYGLSILLLCRCRLDSNHLAFPEFSTQGSSYRNEAWDVRALTKYICLSMNSSIGAKDCSSIRIDKPANIPIYRAVESTRTIP